MNYIPSTDTGFNEWIKSYAKYINENYKVLGLTEEQNKAIQDLYTAWKIDYKAHLEEKEIASSIVKKKDTSRKIVEEEARILTRWLQAYSQVTNKHKTDLRITIKKIKRELPPVPSTRPVAKVDNRESLVHKIHFFDESTPEKRRKPFKVQGCEIWHKIDGLPPEKKSELKYIRTYTRTPCIIEYKEENAGKMVHYWLRWVNSRNEHGPWSETVSATISG